MDKPFQRKGAKNNAEVGRIFESHVRRFFATTGLRLESNVLVDIGVNGKKGHRFDLGCSEPKVLIECKSHTWTEGGNVPSAKITTWDQAMYFFLAAPMGYRKIFVVARNYCGKRNQTLAEYYLRTNSHLIPHDVELWEYDEGEESAKQLR